MMKTKILLPLLSVAGLGATIAPVVAMTSCSCSLLTFKVTENDCLDIKSTSIDANGNLVVEGKWKQNYSSFDKENSKVHFKADTAGATRNFKQIEEEEASAGATYISYGEQTAPKITIYKAYLDVVCSGKKITKVEMIIKGISGK